MKNWFNRFMLKLAARTLERNGLTAVKLVVMGDTTYIEDRNGTLLKIGGKK